MNPPSIALAIVAITAPTADFESICGDLHEEYVRRSAREGQSQADAWYWSQAVRSVPALLSYSRVCQSLGSLCVTLLVVTFSIIALLSLNELIDDAIGTVYHATQGLRAWPFFLAGCTEAAVFGALIAALRRSYGMRLVLFSACSLVGFIAIPIVMQTSSRLSGETWTLILSAALSMCVGGAAYYSISRRHTSRS